MPKKATVAVATPAIDVPKYLTHQDLSNYALKLVPLAEM